MAKTRKKNTTKKDDEGTPEKAPPPSQTTSPSVLTSSSASHPPSPTSSTLTDKDKQTVTDFEDETSEFSTSYSSTPPASPSGKHTESPVTPPPSIQQSKEEIYDNLTAFLKSSTSHHIIYLSRRHPVIIQSLIQKTFQPSHISATRSEAFKLIFPSRELRDKALCISKMGDFPVTVTLPSKPTRTTHTSSTPQTPHNKVVIHGVSTAIAPEEVKTITKSQYVRPLSRGLEGDFVSYMLDFDSTPPTHIIIGLTHYKTHQYIPQPLRCDKCQKFGHATKFCKSTAVICSFCAGPHSYKDCDRTEQQTAAKCQNCGGNHSSAFKKCPKYQQIATILQNKTKFHLSYAEAAKLQAASQTQTQPSQTPSSSTQTDTSATNTTDNTDYPALPAPSIPPQPHAPTPVFSIKPAQTTQNVPHYHPPSNNHSAVLEVIISIISAISLIISKSEGGDAVLPLLEQLKKLVSKL